MSLSHVEALLCRLDGVKSRPGSGRQWIAKCPAHEDKSPSLSIKDTGDKVLLHCFAGCYPDDVLAAVGLTFRDLYPEDAMHAAYRRACAPPIKPEIKVNPLDLEASIVALAEADLKAGKTLSLEDAARVQLAMQRLEAWG